MKRDFNRTLIGLDGQPMLADGSEVLLSAPVVNALLAQFPDEQGLSGEEKFKRYKLAERVTKGGVQEVSAEDIALIKRLVGKAYAPAFVGPTYEALELDPSPDTP